jgi:hypothetical protein
MNSVLIDAKGVAWPLRSPTIAKRVRAAHPDGDLVINAVMRLGFIYILPLCGTVHVFFRPRLVSPKAMAGTFYAITDLRPQTIVLVPQRVGPCCEFYVSPGRAAARIAELVRIALPARNAKIAALVPAIAAAS